MDEAFACPECGTDVQIKGIAPGRQVRCGFCRRLIEVPYLPRVTDPSWRRLRLGRPRWVPWAWGALGLSAGLIVLFSLVQLIADRERALVARSIDRLLATSENHEAHGNLVQALLDLDAAITICAEASVRGEKELAVLKSRRQALARCDAETVRERLSRNDTEHFPLGDWLNLQARVGADNDLASMRQATADRFQRELKRRLESELAAARLAIESGDTTKALERCESTVPLLAHLNPEDQARLRDHAGAIVGQIVARQGIVVDPIRGHLLSGSLARYNETLVPVLIRGLKARGYFPREDSSFFRPKWSDAPHHLTLEVNEKHEGNYLSSENRLTRIEAHLTLALWDKSIWQTTPTARTVVPLPNLPAYLSARVAISPARIEEFERLLYDNARGMIDEKIMAALRRLPECAPPTR
jgi:hypothetical protein